ncbi:MAG: MurR/RpiR family transcriptional regulator [Treponema sp.]|nr:MurR/RpiR family transcriptional regulator [Treponema sp.]
MESALFAIRQYLPAMPSAERRIAACVLNDPQKTLHYNVTELAKESGASQAAIIRFCRRIGMNGFADFKLRLSQDVFLISYDKLPKDMETEGSTEPAGIIKGVVNDIQRNLSRLESLCDVHLLSEAASRIRESRFTGFFGIGASGLVAQDFYQKLIRTGFLCTAPVEADLQITAAVNLKPGDTAFIISYSGENSAMLRCAEVAKKNTACVITLTMESANSLRSMADIPLLVPALEPVYRSGATVSRLTQLAVVDMIHFLILSKDPDSAARALEKTMAATHL